MSDASRIPNNGRYGLLAALLLLGGCGTQGILLPDIDDWETRNQVLGKHEEWQFAGRIGVRAGDDGFNGKLRWEQDGSAFTATVGGPLGIGTVRIRGDASEVVLTDNDGVRTELRDVEAELLLRYGWTIPVTSLRYWALGIPDPARPAETTLDDAGRLASLQQGAWRVVISRYAEGAGQELPQRITATQADTRVRIVVDRWTFFD